MHYDFLNPTTASISTFTQVKSEFAYADEGAGGPRRAEIFLAGPIFVRSFTSGKNTVTLITSANAAPSAAGTPFKEAARSDDDVVATNKLEILIKMDHAGDKWQVAELDGIGVLAG